MLARMHALCRATSARAARHCLPPPHGPHAVGAAANLVGTSAVVHCRYLATTSTVTAAAAAATASVGIAEDNVHVAAQQLKPEGEAQPPRVLLTPAMHAFVARTGLEFFNPITFLQSITHMSFRAGTVPHNQKLEFVGLKVLELMTTEFMHSKYPHLPAEGLSDLVLAYTSESALTELGKQLGLQDIVRWQPDAPDKLQFAEVLARSMAALVGGFYHDRGIVACQKFVHASLLSQKIDVQSVVEIPEPRRTLMALLKRKGMEAPVCRMLHETGRFSSAPIFVVGVFSQINKLGEGVGTSIRMAETRAYKEALYKYFLYDLGSPTLPSAAAELPSEDQLMYRGSELGDTPYLSPRPSTGLPCPRK